MPVGRPQVVAHRGSNSDEPEHSLASYLRAIDEGADAVECDVRLTADGTPICVHDRRIDRTSSGRGAVSRHTLGELIEHDFSGGHEWRSLDAERAAERTGLLTFRTLVAAMLEQSSTCEFAIETKHPVRFGRYVEQAVAEVLDEFGLLHARAGARPRARVMSFSFIALQRMQKIAPRLPLVFLMDDVPRRYRDGSLPTGVTIAGPSFDVIAAHPNYVKRVHDAGGQVHVWTVDRPVDVELCLELGVDAIISNRPGMVRRLVDAHFA